MKADRIDLGLTGYDELFMSTEERLDAKKPKVDELPLDELKPFKEHPFKVMEDEEMERLKESMEDIISDEFTDLTAKKEEPKMKPKPVRSTAGKER